MFHDIFENSLFARGIVCHSCPLSMINLAKNLTNVSSMKFRNQTDARLQLIYSTFEPKFSQRKYSKDSDNAHF